MAKTRRKKIAEVVADPIKKKEAPVDNRSDEQKVFDMGLKIPRTVNDEEYDNSPGEVQENMSGTSYGVSDYRLANQIKQEEQADKTKPGQENKRIPDYTQYTATNGSIKSNEFWNESSGIYRTSMAARKGVAGVPNRNQPSLNNPTGEGYRDYDKTNPSEGSKVAEAMNKPKEEYSRPSRQGDENIFPSNEDKPKEDMGKQQNKVAGDGSKAAEVVSTPTVTNTTVEEEEPLLGGNSVTIDAGKVTTTGAGQYVAPGVALNNAIQSNKAAEETQNAVLKAGIDNAETAGQVFEAPKVAEEAKKEAEKMQTQLDVETVNTVNALGEVMNNMSAQQKQAYGDATQNQLANQTANETVENVRVAPAAYNAVSGGPAGPIRPPYEAITNKDKVEKDITDQYRNLDSSIPQAVVEKLGVQDYYPEIGRDIAVGTFTGSRIGSQTVYSGAGGLLPQGLYDARKRALNDAAKAKQTALDKYYSGIDIAAQFKPKFNETVSNAMDNLLYKKHGGNVNAFLADPESRREFARLEAVAKNVNHYDAYATSILKDAADDTKFIDAEQVKNAQDIKRALVEDVDGVLNGKKDLSALFAKAQVYQNIIPQMDDVIKEALSESRLGKLPINMRTGGVYDDATFVEDRNKYIQKLNDGTLIQADYLSGFKKFFTGNYEQIIDGLVQSGKYSDLQKEAAMNYFAGQMQEQVELKNQFVETGALGAMRLAEDKRQFNAEYARKVEQGETPWDIRNDMMSSKNPSTGKTIQQEFMDMKKQGLTGNALKNKMLQTARDYGFSGASWDPHTKSVILKENATTYESGNVFAVNPYNTKSPAMVKVYTKVTKGGKSTWVPTTVTVNELANSKFGKYNFKDGKNVKPFTNEDISNYRQAIKENALAIQPLTYESTWGSVGSQSGKYNPLGTETIGDYSTDRAVNLKHTTGKGFITIPMKDADGKPVIGADGKPMLKKTALNGELFVQSNISDPFGRTAENAKFGDNKKSFEWVSGEGGGSQSSGSVSSSNQ